MKDLKVNLNLSPPEWKYCSTSVSLALASAHRASI